MNNVLQEVKHFKQYARQLNLLLDETYKSIQELKALQTPLSETIVNIQKTHDRLDYIRSLSRNPITFVISGQNILAKTIITNELVGYSLIPYDLSFNSNDKWRLIRIKYGKAINLAYHLIDSEFELMSLKHAEDANNNNRTTTIQLDDLRFMNNENHHDSIDNSAIADLTIQSKLLESNVEIIIHSENVTSRLIDNLLQDTTRILIYGIYNDHLNDEELKEIQNLAKNASIFFVKLPKIDDSNEFLSNPSKYLTQKGSFNRNEETIFILKQLYEPFFNDKTQETSELCDKWSSFGNKLSLFIKKQLRLLCVQHTTQLYKFHEECLNNFINYAYDCARDMQFTPKKLEYAKGKEQILYESLNSLALIKQEELKNIISQIIDANRDTILQEVRLYEFGEIKDCKVATAKIEELVINRLNTCISQQLTEAIEVLKENYIGTLKRCLETLEDERNEASNDDSVSASKALKEIITSAYQVDVTLTNTSTINIIKLLMERIKELLKTMPWSQVPKLDEQWKLQVAINMLSNLSETKLAKILSIQMKERLKSSHNQFTTSMKLLEAKHTGRLEKAEEIQIQIRKSIAPKFAKLCLESTSLKDLVLNGMPLLGKEIGRGQYGVVYSCTKWSKYNNLAIKSVVPPDEKHWNDLALEFHYTKSIQDHERIVKLLGSVIDYSYANGHSPAVLLIMEGMKCDLHTALKVGLDWLVRLQIAIDVVEGIRFLHGRGLVHRDIKLKNVLLDNQNRAKITDLGFCKPEAMMSGSIVGTPVHMAPEVFNSKYDNTVDIYAFGILFWYICAGQIRLPNNYELCTTKDDLWQAVKRGKRPEKLKKFDNDCWQLMESCWKQEPKDRPHIGEVYDYLIKIQLKFKMQC